MLQTKPEKSGENCKFHNEKNKALSFLTQKLPGLTKKAKKQFEMHPTL